MEGCSGIGLASDNKQNGLLPLRRVPKRMLAVAQAHGGWIEGRGDT